MMTRILMGLYWILTLQTLTTLALLCHVVHEYEKKITTKPEGWEDWERNGRQNGEPEPRWEVHRPTLIFWYVF